jgi:hypothetical protein
VPETIPVLAAEDICKAYGCSQAIVLAFDGERTHVVTYGTTAEDAAMAAAGGNTLKQAMNWPAEFQAKSAKVKALKDRIAALEAELAAGKTDDSPVFRVVEKSPPRSGSYELVYGNGGHGGPYPTHGIALMAAKGLLASSPTEKIVYLVPRSAPTYTAEHATTVVHKR